MTCFYRCLLNYTRVSVCMPADSRVDCHHTLKIEVNVSPLLKNIQGRCTRSCQKNKFFWCAEHKGGIYHDHSVQSSTSMVLTNVLHPHLDVASDFPVVHHRGRSRAGCSHMTSDLPLGSQWGSGLCLGSSCPLMWWLQAVGFAWTHPPWHPSPLDPLHYS